MMKKKNVDRISNLPDELLHDILSHLNIKQVFESSLLSKHWKNLWKSVRKVNIEDNMFEPQGNDYEDFLYFRRFVDNFVVNRHPQTDSFQISCTDFLYAGHSAVEGYLYELIIDFTVNLKAPEIAIQNLTGICYRLHHRHHFYYPPGPQKTLLLSSVVLHPDRYGDTLQLWYGKSLKNLTIRDCAHDYLSHFIIQIPGVKNLIVENNNICESEVESCLFELREASNLTRMELKGYMYQDYVFKEGLPALLTAQLDLKVTNEREGLGKYAWNALRGVSNSQSLTISTYGFGVGGEFEWEEITFPVLKYKLQNVQGEANELKFLKLLVKHAVNLEKIYMTVEAYNENRESQLADFERKVQDIVCSSAHPKMEFMIKQQCRDSKAS